MARKNSALSTVPPQPISKQEQKGVGLIGYLAEVSERAFAELKLKDYSDSQDFTVSLGNLLEREVEIRARRLVRLWVEAYRRGNGHQRVPLPEARDTAAQAARFADLLSLSFQTVPGRTAIRREINLKLGRRWKEYFTRWGCRVCGRMNIEHVAFGYCASCYNRDFQRLKEI